MNNIDAEPNLEISPNEQTDQDRYPLYSQFERRGQKDRFLTVDELETQTDKFIRSFSEGAEKGELPETFFFLDKSARPLAFLVNQLWGSYYPNNPMPKMRFVNIGGSGSHIYDRESKPFNSDPKILSETYGGNLKQDGKILIVDEYSHTGEALNTARSLFAKAFPDAKIQTTVAYSKLPNWYQNEDYLGIEEYSATDYERIALDKLNNELGTKYSDIWRFRTGRNEDFNGKTEDGVDYANITNEIRGRFDQILNSETGTIPYVKKGKHVQTYYREVESTPVEKLIEIAQGKEPERKMEPYQVNHFLEARVELKQIAEEIKDKHLIQHNSGVISAINDIVIASAESVPVVNTEITSEVNKTTN